MIDLNDIGVGPRHTRHAMLGFKIDQQRGTVLTMAALVPSVKFNGTITPREVREQSQTGRRPSPRVSSSIVSGPFLEIPERQGAVTEAAQPAAGDRVAAGPEAPHGVHPLDQLFKTNALGPYCE
jgi:hypothetical protein